MPHALSRRLTLLALPLALAACASWPGSGWVTLIDGERGLDNWNRVGDANWQIDQGGITANQGKGGFLVSKQSYKDFEIYAEFWAATDTNSGIFFRASDPSKITADNSYEANIWDIRPDPIYATGGIVNFAQVPVPTVYKAGGRWNTMEITAKGDQLTVKLNGVQTAQIRNDKYASGPFALQFGPGVKGVNGGPIKWRVVRIKPL
ncbi:MAG TPA: DUF1080 domain-containing protein [Curvibacter sp.]|nr:DUF1080 domain-containing protein [Curvibacter sp.]